MKKIKISLSHKHKPDIKYKVSFYGRSYIDFFKLLVHSSEKMCEKYGILSRDIAIDSIEDANSE